MIPGGWTAGGGKTLSISTSGIVSSLPPLVSQAGPLDDLQWIGSDGKAIAFFGTSGSYYRPEHADPAPEMAFIDARSGKILDRLPFSRLPALKPHAPDGASLVARRVTAKTLTDGRVKAVVCAKDLVVWTQGEPPTVVADPYPRERDNPIRLLPDGRTLLIMRTIQPLGMQCFDCGNMKVPAPTPEEGPLLELHDLTTGKIRWTLRVRASDFWSAPVFSISPDSRYGLVSLPLRHDTTQLALISLADGTILQKIPVGFPGSYAPEAGFLDGGRKVWLRVGSTVEILRFSTP